MACAVEDRDHDQPIYVRVSRSQKVFGLHRSTLYRMAKRGELTIYKVGSVALVSVDDMKQLIEGNSKGAN